MGFTLEDNDGLADVLAALYYGDKLAASSEGAARVLADSISAFAPGSLADGIDTVVEANGRSVTAGHRSPYARWFNVPTLSEGSVQYAKKVSSRGRTYGQRIPDNAFMIDGAEKAEEEVVGQWSEAVGEIIG